MLRNSKNSEMTNLLCVVSCIECGEHLRVNGMADGDLPVGGGGEVRVITEAETVVEGD